MSPSPPRKLTRTLDGLLARFDYAGLLVLVVEPDPDSRGALVRALVGLGLPQPLEAATAAEATAQAAELEPALVLCDALLEGPDGTDGLELLFRIRADSTSLPPDIPVVLLAGDAASPGVLEAKRLGVDGFLVKPVPAKRLEARLNAVLMRRFPERVDWSA